MSEWETSDFSADVSSDTNDAGSIDEIEYLGDTDDDIISDTQDVIDPVGTIDLSELEQSNSEISDNMEELQIDSIENKMEDVPDLADEDYEPSSFEDIEDAEFAESIGEETEDISTEMPDDSVNEILGDEDLDMSEQIDEDAPKVLKLDETEAWQTGSSAIDDTIEAMRDDLRDKGWPDGAEMESMVAAEREKLEDEFRRNLSGDFSNPYLGPDFPEYTGESLSESTDNPQDSISEIQEPVAEISAYDKLNDYYSSHNYGRQHYSEYSQDPEWQALNNDYLASIGRDPIDYSSN